MKRAAILLSLILVGAVAAAAALPDPMMTVHSRSDQFVVSGVMTIAPKKLKPAPTNREPEPAVTLLELEPPLLAVIAERIKVELLRELGAADKWQGKIFVTVRRPGETDSEVYITSERFQNNWQYRIELPLHIEPARLARTLVRALLLELANRSAGERPAEIPLWLSEGFTAQLLASPEGILSLQPEQPLREKRFNTLAAIAPPARDQVQPDLLAQVRTRLHAAPPLAYADLSMPSDDQLVGDAWETYRGCSHLFVTELLKLKDGRAAMREMLRALPEYLNWQFAFYRGFNAHFRSPLEIEKWWSVTLLNFTGRDQHLKWSAEASLQRLDEILLAPVAVRATAKELPERADVKLQMLFTKMKYAQQKEALQKTINQLRALEWNVPPDMLKLVDDYRMTLETYLQKRSKAAGETDVRGGPATGLHPFVRETVARLELLDDIREDFRKYGSPAAPPAAAP